MPLQCLRWQIYAVIPYFSFVTSSDEFAKELRDYLRQQIGLYKLLMITTLQIFLSLVPTKSLEDLLRLMSKTPFQPHVITLRVP